MHERSIWRDAIIQGLRAGRVNLVPGLVIWALAGAVLLAWHHSPATRTALDALVAFKDGWSYPFSMLSTALAGGLFPSLVLRLMTGDHRYTGRRLWWLLLFWATKGAEINALYDCQAWLFGTGDDLATLTTKMLVDQFVYVPIWAVPSTIICYAWIERGRSGLRQDWQPGWYARLALPLLLANLAVWVPAVMLVYALETPLQLPLQNLILCFWSLMVAVIALRRSGTDAD